MSVLTYDAENHLTSYTVSGVSREVYDYDGEGNRVRHQHQTYSGGNWTTAANGTTYYVYDAFGRLSAEYGASTTTSACVTCYLTTDMLGSTRLVTDQIGNPLARYDYLPFGQEILPPQSGGRASVMCGIVSCYSQGAAVTPKFTGQTRDSETGLDYFRARYLSPAQGRFTGADLPFIDQHPADPQSWNLYGYVRNNPLRYVDLDGRQCGREDGGPCPDRDPNEGESPQWRCRRQGLPDCDPGGGGGQQAPRPKAERTPPHPDLPRLACAIQFGQDHSIAALLGAQNNFLVNMFLGNTVSGIAGLGMMAFGNQLPTTGDVATTLLSGGGQGLPGGGPGFKGVVGQASEAVLGTAIAGGFNAVTGVGQEVLELGISSRVGSLATPLSSAAVRSLVGGANLFKFGLDFGTFVYGGVFACR